MLGEEDRQTEKMAISFNQKGISIITLAFIILIIAFLGLVFTSFLTTSSEESVNEYNSTRALYIAEGGAESAMMHLNQPPASTYWLWNDGYLNKSLGDGTVDVEVLQYEQYLSQTSNSPTCTSFTNVIINTTTNPARTVLVNLTWNPSVNANNLGLELYNADVTGSCASPPAGNRVATSTTSNNPEVIRYRIPEPGSFPTTYTYTVRVLGNTGSASYDLTFSHPDESGFGSSDWRSLIALGKMKDAKREVFTAFRK